MSEEAPADRLKTADWTLAVVVTLFLLAVMASSMSWRITHDAPIMVYQAFLMDRFGFVPYRDFFDMNMPGTYLIYFVIGKVFGYQDAPLRAADLLLVCTLCVGTGAMWWRLGRPAALLAGALVGLRYLSFGQLMTLQREFFALIPISFGTAAAVSTLPLTWRSGLAGLAFGVATTIKPHAAIGLAPIVAYLAAEAWQEADRKQALGAGLSAGFAGFLMPVGTMLAWLAGAGLMDDFVHSLGYLKYYGALNGAHHTMDPSDRPAYLLRKLTSLGGYSGYWAMAAAGISWAGFRGDLDAGQRRVVALFGGLLVAYTLYPAASGQFWNYHWLPMNYWIVALVPLFWVPVSGATWLKVLPRVVALGAVLMLLDAPAGADNRYFAKRAKPKGGRSDAIARYLKNHVREGETVQGMDWAYVGISHGMLMAEVELATPYIYTFHFYHHVSTPYIQDLRRDFIEHFDEARPAFVVEGRRGPNKPWVWGKDTARHFPEIEQRLEQDYRVVQKRRLYTIWERKDR